MTVVASLLAFVVLFMSLSNLSLHRHQSVGIRVPIDLLGLLFTLTPRTEVLGFKIPASELREHTTEAITESLLKSNPFSVELSLRGVLFVFLSLSGSLCQPSDKPSASRMH